MIKVDQAPAAVAGPDVLACVNNEVNFDGSKSIDVDGVVNRFTWDFGDGASGGGDRPSHIYRLPGKYRVLLNIEGDRSNQCDNTSSDQTWVRVIEAPVASILAPRATPVSVAAKFDGSGSTFAGGKISRWEWDFGDGETADGAVVEHVFTTAGTYRVALTIHSDAEISDCRSITTYQVVEVNQAPLAMPGSDLEVSVNQDALFDGSASADPDGGIVAYVWDFGDGSNGTGMQVHHQYQNAGRYQVKLSVTDDTDLANNTSSASIWVTVKDPPGPAIQGPLAACVGENVKWRISSDGTLDTAKFAWLLGDGATADTPSVSHKYERPGQYHITLFVDDGSSIAQSRRHSSRVLHVNQPPTAVAGPDRITCPCPAVPIAFDAGGSSDLDGNITRYHWDFGDGETALGAKVEHLFEEPGSYEVRLTVTDDSGSNCAVATDTLQVVVNAQPVADAGTDVVTSNLRVVFDGAASADANGDALTYRWAFGDGHIATGSRVAHTYANGGVYPVILTVDDGTGLNNATDHDSMTVKINRPPVALAGESKRVCTNDVVVFDGSKSTDPEAGVLRYAWDFGDGSVSDIVNPTKIFDKPGTYPVTLRVEDDSGLKNSTHSDRIMIKVDQAPAAVAGPDVLACVNNEVNFDGSKSIDVDGVVNRFTWDFGDGASGGGDRPSHIYRLPGKYRVLLNIEGDRSNQCDNTSSDQTWVRVIEAPVASIASARATPVNVATRFDGAGSTFAGGKISRWEWDFGDGETADGPVVEHVFTTAGTYRVALTIHSDAEISDCRSITTYQVVEVNQAPLAMPGSDLEVSVNQDALFDGSASADPDGGIVAYVWDFGDGSNGTGMQVHHQYQNAGRYQVKLSVTDDTDLANNTSSASIWVTVKDPPGPKIEGPAAACVGETVDWRAAKEEVLDNTKFTWILGDGAQANQASLAHSYKKPGRYNVTLFVDDGSRISQSRRHSTRVLHVNQPPSAEAGPDKLVCPAVPVAFDASGSGDIDGQIKAYHWDFGDGETASGVKPEHVFAKPGTYQVSLTVTDDSGSSCAATTDMVQVVVNAPPVANAGPDHEIFAGGANDVLVFDGSKSNDADKQALSFFWQLGARASLSGERVKHMFTSPGEVDVTLTVSDPTGLACGTASDTMRVIVRGRN